MGFLVMFSFSFSSVLSAISSGRNSSELVSNVRRCHSERSEESAFERGIKRILRLPPQNDDLWQIVLGKSEHSRSAGLFGNSSELVSNVRRCHSERSEESAFERGIKRILRLPPQNDDLWQIVLGKSEHSRSVGLFD